MLRKAKALQVTGGKVYRYQNARAVSGVTRAIDTTEAAVIRRILELYADGIGMLTIAHSLNNMTPGSITGELLEAISKYGRKYGWQHPVLRMEYRGVTPRYSAAQI